LQLHRNGYLLVLLAAIFWGTIGLFYNALMSYGLSPLAVVFWRATLTAVAIFAFELARHRRLPLPQRGDWPLFLAFGAVGVAAFYAIYIYAISLVGMGVAAVLMYTAPAWVTLAGVLFLKERFTPIKGTALLLAIAGCALISRIYNVGGAHFSVIGLLAGLGTGLAYGLYILFGKAAAERRYSPNLTLAYALGIGALCLAPFQPAAEIAQALTTPTLLLWLIALALIPTVGGGIAFNAGLRYLPASNASIVATLEPVVAMVLGWAVMHEQLELWQLLGAGLILTAVVLLQKKNL